MLPSLSMITSRSVYVHTCQIPGMLAVHYQYIILSNLSTRVNDNSNMIMITLDTCRAVRSNFLPQHIPNVASCCILTPSVALSPHLLHGQDHELAFI